MPSFKIQKWASKHAKGNAEAKNADKPTPAYMTEPPAFMANRRLAALFSPEARRDFVINHLRLDPETAALYEQAIRDSTHMIGTEGYGELWEVRKGYLDFWAAKDRGEDPYRTKRDDTLVMVPVDYMVYLREKSKARKRGEIEREVVVFQEKAQQEFYRGFNHIMRDFYKLRIESRENYLIQIQAIGGKPRFY